MILSPTDSTLPRGDSKLVRGPLSAAPVGETPFYSIRLARPEELPAVFEAWAGTWRNSPYAGCISNDEFYPVTYRTITQLLTRGMQVTVLVPVDRPDQMLAWVAHEHDTRSEAPVVHYLFTKDAFRKRGLSRVLLDSIGATRDTKFIYTHRTGFAKYYPSAYPMPAVARRAKL